MIQAALFSMLMSSVLLAETPARISDVAPESVEMDLGRLAVIDDIVREGLEQGKMPGCVVLVGRREGIVFRKAFGFRQTTPQKVPMTLDTVFDLASLAKPIATATSVMILVEQGKLELDAPVGKYLPEFSANGKEAITVRHLLLHTGGLIADNSIDDYADGPEVAFTKIYNLKLSAGPGDEFTYSDVGFIVLGQIVKSVSEKNVHEFAHEAIFDPLGMAETGYLPDDSLKARAAVTQERNGHWMQGEVHDPRAYSLGGVAGHASTIRYKYVFAMVQLVPFVQLRSFLVFTHYHTTHFVDIQSRIPSISGMCFDICKTSQSVHFSQLFSEILGHFGIIAIHFYMNSYLWNAPWVFKCFV